MSSRIIRGDNRGKAVYGAAPEPAGAADHSGEERALDVEKQAFEQGYKEGERIGKQMGERMVEMAVKRYDRSVQQLAELQQSLVEAMEKQTVQLALSIARKIVQREVATDHELIGALVSIALKRVQGQSALCVRVCPQDFARLNEDPRALGPSIALKEDPSLERGDFILDTTQTHVDGRVASQIETIGRALLDE